MTTSMSSFVQGTMWQIRSVSERYCIQSYSYSIWPFSETPPAPFTPVVSNIQPTSVRLTWIPPQYDGNSPILSYIVEAKKGSNGWQRQMDNINPSTQRVSVLVRNLLPHTQYQFRVRAENQVGIGAPSAASGSIMTLIAGKYRLSHVQKLINNS